MKINNRILLVIGILLLIQMQTLGVGFQTVKVKNKSKQDFWIGILAMSCDTFYQVQLKHIRSSDTTFVFLENSNNLIFTFLNSNRSLMTTLPVFCEKRPIEIQVHLDSNSNDQSAFYKNNRYKGGMHGKEFSKFINQFLLNAILNNSFDTTKVIKNLKIHEKASGNIFASWLIVNLLSDRESRDYKYYREKISACPKFENQFFPQEIVFSKDDFKSSEDFYDTLYNDLRRSCLTANDLIQLPLFEEDTCFLIFWASWCGPCIKQIKKMTNEQLQSKKYFFISIDVEVQNGLKMAKSLKIDNRLLFLDSSVLGKYGYKSIPVHLKLIKESKEVLLE